ARIAFALLKTDSQYQPKLPQTTCMQT
ncbi:hypothetical protein HDE77_003856, partial [Rhodanobacter sp. MP7CTX1]|nr:hypothetical protein [Rhodanobacter sp. MP7CTX1]MBB6189475.1 hypothetical protein [Rhodanobacter sp. MP7CTX1]